MKTKEERYIVDLSSDERSFLESLIRRGGHSRSVVSGARILLKAVQGWTDPKNAEFAGVSLSTVFRVQRRFVEEGLDAAVFRKNTGKRLYRKLDGEAEATLITTACSAREKPYPDLRTNLMSLNLNLGAVAEPEV